MSYTWSWEAMTLWGAYMETNRSRLYASVIAILISVSIGGCAGWWDYRYGPQPVIASEYVQSSTDNYKRVATALMHRVGIEGEYLEDGTLKIKGNYDPYDVAEAGFGYVNEVCSTYLYELFKLDRRRQRIGNSIVALDKTTAALLGAANSTQPAILIAAQAFGLAHSLSDAFAESYLFALGPGLVTKKVAELQAAYRENAKSRRAEIRTMASVYVWVQGYLNLCMAPTIEGEVTSLVAGSKAVVDQPAKKDVAPAQKSGTPTNETAPTVSLRAQ